MSPTKEKITVPGSQLISKIKQLIARKDVRRVCIIHEERRLLEVPVRAGDPAAPAAVLATPVLAAIGALSALVNECTIEVERAEGSESIGPSRKP
ncbi:MAG: DUF4342 domain-containing protein [Chloroflexi bacterium]|nr:DUF4342 domain-containing protein [Chloroflexota bacterium]